MFFEFGFILILIFLNFCDARIGTMSLPIADFKAPNYLDVTAGFEPVHPIQLQCNIPHIDTTDIESGTWVLIKVTPFPQPDGFDREVNFCSPFCYNSDVCQGVRVLIEDNDGRTMIFNTYSRSRSLANMVHFKTSVMKVDFIHAIYQGHLKLMETLTENGQFDDVDHIPPIIIKTQSVPFVKILSSANGMWMIFKTCDQHEHTWVLLSREAIDNQETYAKYKNEYNEALSSLYGVDAESMVDVPLSDYASSAEIVDNDRLC